MLEPFKVESSWELNKKVLSAKKISIDKNIDFNFLAEEEFSIGQKIKTLGWNYFCSLDKPTCPDLIRKFYMNLIQGENGLYTIVRNTSIQVDPDTLCEELKFLLVVNTKIVPSRRACLTTIMANENLDFDRDYLIRDFTP